MIQMSNFSWKKNIVSIALLAVGLLLIVSQLVSDLGAYLHSFGLKIEHPKVYEYKAYDDLLRAKVSHGLVDYQSLKKSGAADKAVRELEHISPDLLESPAERLTFWLNAYNLLSIKNILDKYPIDSLQELGQSPVLKKFTIGGKLYSPVEIEREQIRPLLKKDNFRAVFLMCPGARGYPALFNRALRPDTLEKDMQQATIAFVVDPLNNQWDADDKAFRISRFFRWNEALFTSKYGNPFALVNAFSPPESRIVLDDPGTKYEYIPEFNWLLNDTSLEQRLGMQKSRQP